jgi:hypothetical protein
LGYNLLVGSVRFEGVLFVAYSNDHPPRHVHDFTGETEAIIELRSDDLRFDGTVALATRNDAIRPANAKRSDVKKVMDAAARHFNALVALWEEVHGKT